MLLKLDNAGDVVLASLLLPAIYENLGGPSIVCVVRKGLGGLLGHIGCVKEVVEVPFGLEHCSQVRANSKRETKAARRMVREAIRAEKPDLVIDLRTTSLGIYAALRARLEGTRHRVTLDDVRLKEIFGDREARRDKWTRHEAMTFFLKLKSAGALPEGAGFHETLGFWDIPADERAGGTNGLRMEGHRPYVLVQPGAVWEFKRWPEAGFSALINSLAADLPHLGFVLAGTGEESAVCERVMDGLGSRVLHRVRNLAGRTTLKELILLVNGAELVVANDSGVAHIAGALGKKTVVFFGPSAPERFAPLSPSPGSVRVFYHRMDCSPCDQLACGYDAKTRCLARIDPEEVAAHVKVALAPPRTKEAGCV